MELREQTANDGETVRSSGLNQVSVMVGHNKPVRLVEGAECGEFVAQGFAEVGTFHFVSVSTMERRAGIEVRAGRCK